MIESGWQSAVFSEQRRGIYATLLLFASPAPGASAYSGGLWLLRGADVGALSPTLLGIGYLALGILIYAAIGVTGYWLSKPRAVLGISNTGFELASRRKFFTSVIPFILATAWAAVSIFGFCRDELRMFE